MKKILFPTDFSDNAKNAFRYALKLAEKLNAKIDVIHIYSIVFNDVAALPPEYVEQSMANKKKVINEQLEAFMLDADPLFTDKQKAIYGVFPATEISEYAARKNYDYIVMGTKGSKNALDRIIGTVTSSVILHASCPVIAIPESAAFEEIYSIALAISFANKNEYAIRQLEDFANQVKAGIHLVHVNSKSEEPRMERIMNDENYTATFTQFTVVHNPSVIRGLEDYIKENQINMLALHIPSRRLWERIFHQSVSKKMALHTKTPLIVFHQ